MTCIHLQAELNKEAINTYTLRLWPRTPSIEKTHLFLQYSVTLSIHRWFCLLRGFQHFESQTMTRCRSLCFLYKVQAIELDLQLQLHEVVLFSHYSLTELSKERLFHVEILQAAFQGLAPSRCHAFFCTQQSNTWEPGDDHNEPSSSDVRSLKITSLVFLIFCIHFIALSIIL